MIKRVYWEGKKGKAKPKPNKPTPNHTAELPLKSYICPAWIRCGGGLASIWELNYLF